MSSSKPKLVIVESPAKCAKITSFLGAGWTVMASMGHIRVLQEKLDAVGIDRNWEPIYEELAGKRDQIAKLRKTAKEASEVWLATDDDREGEGIAWHICHILKLKPETTPRIVFHEITRAAIQAAVAAPRRLDMNRVNAQQARSMLDLLVGFTISPVLWKRVAPKLSAGRCQTPALRLVVERDAEIAGHVARNYWNLSATIGGSPTLPSLTAEAAGEFTEAAARSAVAAAAATKPTAATATFKTVKERIATSAAPAPLITSTLQQEASALHGLGPKATMHAAQKLYEAGHITYMRTDNAILSAEAAALVRAEVEAKWGAEYVGSEGQHQGQGATTDTPAKKPAAKSKKAKEAKEAETKEVEAQAAHEAIRPTHPEISEITDMEHEHRVVYRLIWRRAIQSQMAAARTAVRSAALDIPALPTVGAWSAEQSKPIFEGWHIVERTQAAVAAAAAADKAWDAWTPVWRQGATVAWTAVKADEVFTKPTGRYTEATLIRELEKRGIGRPSTFASLVGTLFDRGYVEKTNTEGRTYETRHISAAPQTVATEARESHKTGAEKNKVAATPLGVSVAECLGTEFADLFAYDFTAHMEGSLDAISEGTKPWKSILAETWATYKDRYESIMREKGGAAKIQTVGGAGGAGGAGSEGGAGAVKVVQTKRGPLLVRDKADGSGAEFAPLPTGVSAANAAAVLTAEAIEAAFAAAKLAREGEMLGIWVSPAGEECEIRKKRGPFGWYVQADDVKVPCKPDDTLESLQSKLSTKAQAFERTVGPYMIKQGPYGFYFYKTGGKGKPKFVGVPKTADPATITEAELTAAATAPPPAKPKRTYKKKSAAGGE